MEKVLYDIVVSFNAKMVQNLQETSISQPQRRLQF